MRYSLSSRAKRANRKGVFGLTSVQAFFAIILSIALLAYVIVVIMGTLSESTILLPSTLSAKVINESGQINDSTPYTLTKYSVRGFASPAIVYAINATDNKSIAAANFSLSTAGVITNASAIRWHTVKFTYTYNYNANTVNDATDILSNTSSGISGFFSAINPVYSILAILVIILVLVVLVRVVSGGEMSKGSSQPQL